MKSKPVKIRTAQAGSLQRMVRPRIRHSVGYLVRPDCLQIWSPCQHISVSFYDALLLLVKMCEAQVNLVTRRGSKV